MSEIHHHSQHEKVQSLAEGRQAIVQTKKKTKPHRKLYHEPKKSAIRSSLFGVGFQPSFAQGKNITNSDGLTFEYFADKYMDSDLDLDKLTNQMMEVIEGKIYKTQCLRIYHDELKFLSSNRSRSSSFKMNLNTLKSKAKVEESMWNQKYQMQRYLLESQEENQLARMYIMYVTNFLKEASTNQQYSKNQVIDLDQEEEVMMNNLQLETSHLVKQLRQEKKRNVRQLKEIQEEIQDLRILIQQKQQLLRDYKAKICTLYIKLNNRKSSKAKQRNLSLSIKKFNNQNHKSLKEAFIGNNHFKTYSKEILEKVTSEEELVKIKFYAHGKENLSFQCLYKSKEGQLHSSVFDSRENSVEQLAEKENCEQAVVKYLLSIKFYFKSKIVGVEYRIKTDKGNKHVQIGTCLPNIQHELLTLINKEVVTLGSFWHGKEMIGVSIWYQDKIPSTFRGESKIDREMKRSTKKKTALKSFDQYYV